MNIFAYARIFISKLKLTKTTESLQIALLVLFLFCHKGDAMYWFAQYRNGDGKLIGEFPLLCPKKPEKRQVFRLRGSRYRVTGIRSKDGYFRIRRVIK